MELTSYILIFLGLLATGQSYYLDGSCNSYAQTVTKGMQGAFDLAQASSDTLRALTHPSTTSTWQAQHELIRYLFSDALHDGIDDGVDPDKPEWQTVSRTLTSVLRFNDNNGQPNPAHPDYRSLTPDNLVVFCDLSRFIETPGSAGRPVRVRDSITGYTFDMNPGYAGCKVTGSGGRPRGSPGAFTFTGARVSRFTYIQLCPWYIRWFHNQVIQTFEDLQGRGFRTRLVRNWRRLQNRLRDRPLTPMDLLYLFDATLFHEMTHAIPEGATQDVGGLARAYGWRNCMRQLFYNEVANADNYVYFGIGSRMISPHRGIAQRPEPDGTIRNVDPRNPRPSPRSIHGLPAVGGSNSRDIRSLNSSNGSAPLSHASSETGRIIYNEFPAWSSSNTSWYYDVQQAILLEGS